MTKPSTPSNRHPTAKPYPKNDELEVKKSNELDIGKMYGDLPARLKAERDKYKSYMPVIEIKP